MTFTDATAFRPFLSSLAQDFIEDGKVVIMADIYRNS